ncbi:MAG: radical SAM protein [Alphaproteobacteria bacterium]
MDDVRKRLSPALFAAGRSLNSFFAKPQPLPMAPISINLDLTVACNYRCPHCIDSEIINTKAMFSLDEVTDTLINLRICGLRSVILIGGGEPTAHPKFETIVRLIKALGLQCAIVSNGSRTDRIARVAGHMTQGDWVRLSLDAGSDEVFQHLHKPAKKITLTDICRGAVKIKKANSKLQLGYSFIVITPEALGYNSNLTPNIHEIALAAALAKEHGFDYLSLKQYLARDADGKEVIPFSKDCEPGKGETLRLLQKEVARARKHVCDGFKIIESINLIALLTGATQKQTSQPRRCHMQRFRQVVTPRGIYACPAYRGDKRSLVAGKMGYTKSANCRKTLWRTNEQVSRFDASYECRNITCIYNSTNWWLDALASAPETSQDWLPALDGLTKQKGNTWPASATF